MPSLYFALFYFWHFLSATVCTHVEPEFPSLIPKVFCITGFHWLSLHIPCSTRQLAHFFSSAVNLAISLSRLKGGRAVGLLDADVYGPSIPKMMNLHGQPELNRREYRRILYLSVFACSDVRD